MMEEHFFKNPNSTAQFYSFFDTVLFYVATVCVHHVKVRLLWKLLIIFQ